jgi:hypothetical protein
MMQTKEMLTQSGGEHQKEIVMENWIRGIKEIGIHYS